jgi:similar to stage IV sporulation protein
MNKSYVEFTAFGVYCGEFIDYLISSEHYVFDVCADSNLYKAKSAPQNYPAIAKKAREYGVRTRVVGRGGAYFLVRKHRKRIGVMFGVLAFLGIIVAMSNFVWDINIVGNSEVGRYRIMAELDKQGIRTGIRTNAFDANLAELRLALAIDELAWVNIERAGSRINVKVSESVGNERGGGIPLSRPTNVVATRSGQLVSANIYRGELLGVVGVPNYVMGAPPDEDTGISSYRYVHADAVLIAEIVEYVDFHQPFTVMHRADNGHSANNRSVIFLGHRFGNELPIPAHAAHVDYSEKLYAPRLFGLFTLPVRILEQNYVFSDRIEVTDTPVNAKRQLDNQIELYERNFILTCDTAEIVERVTEYYPDEFGISAMVRYVFRVDVAVKTEIVLS